MGPCLTSERKRGWGTAASGPRSPGRFGGKSAVAAEVWARFGDVNNYVEPFFGSGAVLLGRPHWPFTATRTETVNDLDALLSNFWRALAADPETVAAHAEWPVNEVDLHARHLWLLGRKGSIAERLMADPDAFDAKAAGWWVWGASAWIGSGWCSGRGPWQAIDGVLTKVGNAGRGVNRQMPHVGNAGRGVNRKMPHVGDAGRGVNRQMPHVGDAGRGRAATHLLPVAERMRDVRVACGDWTRVLGCALWPCGGRSQAEVRRYVTGVFLDPPYGEGDDRLYASTDGLADETRIAADVWRWAVENGDDPTLRIAVCGYEDGRTVPEGWATLPWAGRGRGAGYGNRTAAGKANLRRETIWFSPHCLVPSAEVELVPVQPSLLESA